MCRNNRLNPGNLQAAEAAAADFGTCSPAGFLEGPPLVRAYEETHPVTAAAVGASTTEYAAIATPTPTSAAGAVSALLIHHRPASTSLRAS